MHLALKRLACRGETRERKGEVAEDFGGERIVKAARYSVPLTHRRYSLPMIQALVPACRQQPFGLISRVRLDSV